MEERVPDASGVDGDAEAVADAQRDPRQFVALYDRYAARVYRYVRMRVRHEQTSEDITSQVFATALARIESFRTDGSFAAWLFRVAHNAVQDTYRRRTAAPMDQEMVDAVPDRDPGPEARALAGEDAEELRALISGLRSEQQHLLALRFGAGLNAGEIGAILGKSAEAVRVALHRTITELRLRYEE